MADANVSYEGEEWRDIKGFEGFFQVSNLGRVRGIQRMANVRNGQRSVKGRVLAYRKHMQGYYQAPLGRGKAQLVHRLVAMAFIANPLNKPFVNHIDGVKTNNCVSNLEWVTRQENENHAVATGLKSSVGQNNTMAKLTDDAVRQMRDMYTGKRDDFASIASHFGVTGYTAKRAIEGKTWKHI